MGRIGSAREPAVVIANCLAINAAKMRCLGRGANTPVNEGTPLAACRAALFLCVIGEISDRRQVASTEISRHTVKETTRVLEPARDRLRVFGRIANERDAGLAMRRHVCFGMCRAPCTQRSRTCAS